MVTLVSDRPQFVPSRDRPLLAYDAYSPPSDLPRIYFVNGIQTSAEQHADIAQLLSVICERTIYGLYNASAGLTKTGFVLDLLQCGADWVDILLSKLAERGNEAINSAINETVSWCRRRLGRSAPDPINVADKIRRCLPETQRIKFIEWCIGRYNPATVCLFHVLRKHSARRQIIVAHSQGNLVTCDALWSMSIADGESSLRNIEVLSLASPAPAWPMGMRGGRRKVYGNENDLVTLADPHNWDWIMHHLGQRRYSRTAGDWRVHGDGKIGLPPHDIKLHLTEMNFSNRLRSIVGLPPLTYDERTSLVNS